MHLQGGVRRRHALIFVYVFFRFGLHVGIRILCENKIRQGLQPALDRNARTSLFLLFIRTVDILHLRKRHGGVQRFLDFLRHLFLFRDRLGDFRFSLFEIAKIRQPVVEFAQHLVVATAGHFLSVPCNERDGIPFVDQLNNVLSPVLAYGKFFRQFL